ncbi:MAG: bifunctional folylpolyglutamate synthase/dihydrofolate synthase, partial [Bacteroidaceae bacterium]|nr:bifunctional folylpolyglutamate synthase/dihydrofolate synthase [Bacteroidaceae bacterium]
MNYKECIEYLYNCAPLFQNIGKDAYKEGLDNTMALDKHFNHPHRKFKSIHIAGTNGKGSCSHTIASILQSAGYKVGLYTSPHLVDFRERIRINGEMIPEESVIEFVTKEKEFFEPLHPSFFELTTALAFKHFADNNIDIAVVETGLGGRLDCTNIITPELCVITNISFDHTQFLGDTIEKIAKEKAGIIKSGVPVVIGESVPESKEVFNKKAEEEQAPIIFADESDEITGFEITNMNGIRYTSKTLGVFHGELGGEYQIKNTATIISAISELRKTGISICTENIIDGFN